MEVHPDGLGPVVRALGHDRVDHQQARSGGHRRAAGREDPPGVGVVPVVQDAGEQIGVGAGRDGGEEVARHALGAALQTGRREPGFGARHRLGAVDEHAVQRGRRVQDRLEQHPRAAADVDKLAQAGEVVGRDDVGGLALRAIGHRGLEGRLALRVGREVGEERLAVDVLERRAAFGHRAQEPGGRRPVQLAARHRRRPLRAGHAFAQVLAERREREAAAIVLGEDVVERQPAQHARQGGGLGADGCGDLGAGPRPVGQDVGDAELRGDVEQLGRQVAVDEARKIALRRGRCGGIRARHRLPGVHRAIDARLLWAVNRATRTPRAGPSRYATSASRPSTPLDGAARLRCRTDRALRGSRPSTHCARHEGARWTGGTWWAA